MAIFSSASMSPVFKVELSFTTDWPTISTKIVEHVNSLDSGADQADLGRLLEHTCHSLGHEAWETSGTAFLDERPELPTVVVDKHAIVMNWKRLMPGTYTATVLTYSAGELGENDQEWPRTGEPCSIGPVEEIHEANTPPSPAISRMRSDTASGRVQVNGEPFNLVAVLNKAACSEGCHMNCISIEAGTRTRDENFEGGSYTLRAEFDVNAATGYIDGSVSFRPSVLKAGKLGDSCPPKVSLFVNQELQKAVQESIVRCLPWSSLNSAQRASRLATVVSSVLKLNFIRPSGERRVTRYGDANTQGERSTAPNDHDEFTVEVRTGRGRLSFVIRDPTLTAISSSGVPGVTGQGQ